MTDRDIEELLMDVRKDIIFSSLTQEEQSKWEKSPKERHALYEREKTPRIHAERYPATIKSYKKYGCFLFAEKEKATPGKYYIDEDYVQYCKKNGDTVKLSADILTNEGAIKEALAKHSLSPIENERVMAFYKVAYTIGNFSLIWKNPGGDNGLDVCWRKLENSDMYINGILRKRANGIENRKNIDNNLQRRNEEDLFMILPLENPREVMQQLYFQDYYKYNWGLRWSSQNVKKLEKEELLNFIRDITILIVQRSYRILHNRKGNVLTPEDQLNIKTILNKII